MMTTKLIICLLFCGVFTIQTVGHMNSDPAPGRSPGPPKTIETSPHDHDDNGNRYFVGSSEASDIKEQKYNRLHKNIRNNKNNNYYNNINNNNEHSLMTANAGSAINLILDGIKNEINTVQHVNKSNSTEEFIYQRSKRDQVVSLISKTTTPKTTTEVANNDASHYKEAFSRRSREYTTEIDKTTTTSIKDSKSPSGCDEHLSEFLNDVVVVDESEPTDSENDTQHPLLGHGFNIQLKLEHDIFDTTTMGINCGMMYKVRLVTNMPPVPSNSFASQSTERHTPITSAHYSGEFLVESFSSTNSRERGSFVGHSMGNKLPISWFSALHRSGKDGKTDVPLKLFSSRGQNGIKADAMRNEFNSVIASNENSDYDHTIEAGNFYTNNSPQQGSRISKSHAKEPQNVNAYKHERLCHENIWRDIAKSHPNNAKNGNRSGESTESVNFWLLNELCSQDDTIEFRVFFRASIRWISNETDATNQSNNNVNTESEQLLHKKTFKFKLRKDCEMLLRDITTGTLDYTMLPLYSNECIVHFPSYQQQQQEEQKNQQEHEYTITTIGHAAPGILVELQRLNVPCGSGGYVRFSNRSMLCGKLEELPDSERMYHFDVRSQTSVQFLKNPMFSLSFKLVDSCYNVSSSNQSAEFYVQPTRYDSLECYFRIHLPYGNRIMLRLVANNASDILPANVIPSRNDPYTVNGRIPFGEQAVHNVYTSTGESIYTQLVNMSTSDNPLFTLASQRPQMNWVNEFVRNYTIGNSNGGTQLQAFLNANSKVQIPSFSSSSSASAKCGGIIIKVFENDFSKWSHCVENSESARAFVLESTGNTLSVHFFRAAQQQKPQQHATRQSGIESVNTVGVLVTLPTVYLSYEALPVRDIVSNCAFGWVAIQQFCVTVFERPLRWHEAEQHCVELGGHLTSIRNEMQQEVINNLLQHSPGYRDQNAYWIGGSDKSYEGDFRWTDGLSFQYTNWFSGWMQHGHYNKQPNDDGLSHQDCIELRRYFRTPPGIQTNGNPLTHGFMWNDRDCNANNFPICERAISDETFRRNWFNDCNKTVSLTKEHSRASVWSPSFPRQYPDNANCFTTITAPVGYRIVIEFEELVIENEPGCTYDYLEITEPTHMDYARYSKASKHKNAKNNSFNTNSNNSNNNTNRNFRKRNSYENPSLNLYTTSSTSPSTSTYTSTSTSTYASTTINSNTNTNEIKDNKFNFNDNGDNYLYANNYNNYNLAQSNYEKFLHIVSNLYKPHTNYIVQTPDYPKGNPHYHHSNPLANDDQLPKRLCGDWSSKLKLLRHVTMGSYLGLHFVSDYSHHFGGFKAKAYMENTISECANERLKSYNGSCYLFVSYPEVDWWTAQQVCRGMNAKLSSVSTSDEHRFITANIRNQIDYSPQLIYWLGAELEKNGQFEWIDDTQMSFQGWLPGQGQFDVLPPDATCLGLQWKMSPTPMLPSGLYWQSQKCNKIGGYVCKKAKENAFENSFTNFTITGTEGRLLSPAYPSTYPLNLDYWVHIKSPERTRIIIQFQKIDLEPQDECLYDFVSIEDFELVSKITLEPGANPIPIAMLTPDDEISSAVSAMMTDGDNGMQTLINSRRIVHRQRRRKKRSMEDKKFRLTTSTAKRPKRRRNIEKVFHKMTQSALQIPRHGTKFTKQMQTNSELIDSAKKFTNVYLNKKNERSMVEFPTSYNNGHNEESKRRKNKRIYFKNSNSDNDKTERNENPKHRRRKKFKKEIENKFQKSKNEVIDEGVTANKKNLLSEVKNDRRYEDFTQILQGRQRKRRSLNGIKVDSIDRTLKETMTSRNFNFNENGQTFLPYVRWCGSHDTNMSKFDFVSSSNQVLINFHSDYSITGLGFAAVWKAVDFSGCPMQTLTSRQGTVMSPNYPHFLLHNMDCAYVIKAPMGRRVWLEFIDYDLYSDGVLEVDIGDGSFRPFRNEQHLNDGIFVSLREQLRIQFRTGQHPRGKGFQAIYHTMGQLERRERVINLTSNATGNLFQLNYPREMPENVDFTQHLVAPFGANILLELHDVEFTENGCPDNSLLEVYDNYADNNGTKWQLCKFQISENPYEASNFGNTAWSTESYNSAYEHQQMNHYDRLSSAAFSFNSHFQQYDEIAPPVYITSYMNTLHIRQLTTNKSVANLNATVRIQLDYNYKIKLSMSENTVESCHPNPCQFNGKCITSNGSNYCQCHGRYAGRFCGLTVCDMEPCVFGKCELTVNSFKCQCQPGYMGTTCEQKQRPCADNPCEGRGICFERNGGFFCRCHAWWEGHRCERRMLHIPYKPLSERMLQEPFWLGLITVFVVLAVIGLVWCAKRHFPEKIEKLLAEEADRNRPPGSIHGHHHHTSLREQLQFTTAIPQTTVNNVPGAPRSIFNRLGIRKPSLLSLSSPNPTPGGGGAAARTFSLDDLLRPPPRRSPSPRKKRNNSTPVKKNAAEKKQILQQLVSPAVVEPKPKLSLGELITMSENRLRVSNADSESDLKETTFSENSGSLTSSTVARTIGDPKLEKKVTFARLLNKVSAEMSSGSEMDIGHMGGTRNSSALSLPTDIQYRASSMPPSPCTNDIRSPHSTSSNQCSDSLSSSDLALNDFGLRSMQTSSVEIHGPNKHIGGLPLLNTSARHRSPGSRPKVSSADSILAMFRNFANSNSNSNTNSITTSVFVSPSTTPTASSPQDDAPGDDDSSTSSMHTPVSFSSFAPDSPVFYRQTTIEVPVLDALNAHKNNSPSSSTSSSSTNLLHPPSILLEIPSNGINKCLSPIREMPTPIPSPALTPIMPRPQRSNSPIFQEDPLSGGEYTDDEDDKTDRSEHSDTQLSEKVFLGLKKDKSLRLMDSDVETTPTETTSTSTAEIGRQHSMHRMPLLLLPPPSAGTSSTFKMPLPIITIDVEPPTPEERATRPRDLIIPTLTVQQPSPTKNRHPLIIFPGSPPPQRASIGETSFMFPNKQQQKRLLKQFEKPTSLEFPFAPPTITVTSNMSEMESDTESLSPAPKSSGNAALMPPNPVGMCYLSPFTMCSRADRTISESNLSSSGYSSMASPGPSRCGSSNPLCPNEMDEPGSGHSGAGVSLHVSLMNRRKSSTLASCKENVSNGEGNSSGNNTQQQQSHRPRSDSETFSDDILIESNDEGIGTDHIDEKLDENRLSNARFKELGKFMEDQVLIELDEPTSGSVLAQVPPQQPQSNTSTTSMNQMAQLQLPSIVIQIDGSEKGLSPVSSRSESPLSERASIGRFSPHFYGRKDQLPFTDSDGLYDFPSSDGKGTSAQLYTHQRRSNSKKRERKSSKCFVSQSPTKQQLELMSKDLLNTPTTSTSSHHVCNKHCNSHNHPCPATVSTARKSPKRRLMNRLPIASSSSSSESLTSTKDIPTRPLPRRLNSPNRERRPRKQESLSEDEVADALLRRISPSVVKEETPAKPRSKIHRLRAIGNQIRFLRRLEKSIKTRERIVSPSDSCPEENTDDMDSPQATSPLLQPTSPNKTRTALCRQKRVPGGAYALNTTSWKGMDQSLIADDLNSD